MSFLLCCCVKRSAPPDEAENAAKESVVCNYEEIEIPRMDDFEFDCDDAEGSEIVNGNNSRDKPTKVVCYDCNFEFRNPLLLLCHEVRIHFAQLAAFTKTLLREVNIRRKECLPASEMQSYKPIVLNERLQQVASNMWYWQTEQQVRFRHFPSNGMDGYGCLAFRSAPFTTCLSTRILYYLCMQISGHWVCKSSKYHKELFARKNLGTEEYWQCWECFKHLTTYRGFATCGLHVGIVRAEPRDLIPGSPALKKPAYLICAVLVFEKNNGNPANHQLLLSPVLDY